MFSTALGAAAVAEAPGLAALRRDGLFFFHNPKAGGTTLRRMFERLLPTDRFSPLIENDPEQHLACKPTFAAWRGHGAYFGHYGRDLFEAVRVRHQAMTSFRHPAARVFSLYRYFRDLVALDEASLALDRFAAVRAAKTLPFEAFALNDDARVAVYTVNQHARQLSGSLWEFGGSVDMPRALDLLDRMPWFYVCEQKAASLAWAQAQFGVDPASLGAENVNAVSPARGRDHEALERIAERVAERNALDLALHAAASKRLAAF